MAKFKIDVEHALKLSDIQLAKLSDSELRQVVQVLASAGNKRIKRLEKAGIEKNSYSYNLVMNNGGKFSTKDKNRNALHTEYKRAKLFMMGKTSTVKGTRESIKKQKKIVKERYGTELTTSQLANATEAMGMYRERYGFRGKADESDTIASIHFTISEHPDFSNQEVVEFVRGLREENREQEDAYYESLFSSEFDNGDTGTTQDNPFRFS